MTDAAHKLTYTFAEYLALERAGDTKHELINGEIFAMAGGTPEHGRLATRVIRALATQLADRPCEAFSSDVLLRVRATNLGTYPDISVVCGRLERDPEDPNVIVNPIVLVEVLSDGTERYDRGEKLAHYRRIPSLQEYVLVSPRTSRASEVFRRNDELGKSWTLHIGRGHPRTATWRRSRCEVAVDEVYANALG